MEADKVAEIMSLEFQCVLRQKNGACNRDENGCQCCNLIQNADEVLEAYDEVIKVFRRMSDYDG